MKKTLTQGKNFDHEFWKFIGSLISRVGESPETLRGTSWRTQDILKRYFMQSVGKCSKRRFFTRKSENVSGHMSSLSRNFSDFGQIEKSDS